MNKIVLAFTIVLVGILIGCSTPTQYEGGTLWGTGIYEGLIAAPITFLTINFTKGSIGFGKDSNGMPVLEGLILESKSTLDTLCASISDSRNNSYPIRLAIDYKNNRGCRGRWIPLSEDYDEIFSSPEFVLIKIK